VPFSASFVASRDEFTGSAEKKRNDCAAKMSRIVIDAPMQQRLRQIAAPRAAVRPRTAGE
jgi:hypothetical protein